MVTSAFWTSYFYEWIFSTIFICISSSVFIFKGVVHPWSNLAVLIYFFPLDSSAIILYPIFLFPCGSFPIPFLQSRFTFLTYILDKWKMNSLLFMFLGPSEPFSWLYIFNPHNHLEVLMTLMSNDNWVSIFFRSNILFHFYLLHCCPALNSLK